MANSSAKHSGFPGYQGTRNAHYDLDAPPSLPEVIDDDSEASWALWREATSTSGDWESDTQPMGLDAE